MRALGWRLLASLYLNGPTERSVPLLRRLPGLAVHLPGRFDADEAAAEHHRVFGMEVFPWASVFLEDDGRPGGVVSEAMGRRFGRAGLPAPGAGSGAGDPPDHLGHELRLLAELTGGEDPAAALDLLLGHLLWWLPVFVHSAARHASPLWRAVLQLTLDAALDQAGHAPPVEARPPGALSRPVKDPLSDPDAGLARVARHLVTPVRSGLFLGLADIRALGREADVPAGFGRRERVLANLLRSASAYGGLGEVLDGIRGVARAQGAFLARVPPLHGAPWLERLEALEGTLGRLASAGKDA